MNNDKYSNHFHKQRKHFSLFFISVDSILGREALVVLMNLSELMVVKIDEPISHVHSCINFRIIIAVIKSYSQIIFEDELPIPLRYRVPYWDLASGIRSAQ